MKARVPGTCGEWIQGWLDGEAVLVSCPIEVFAEAEVTHQTECGLRVTPPERVKALQAASIVLDLLDCHVQQDYAQAFSSIPGMNEVLIKHAGMPRSLFREPGKKQGYELALCSALPHGRGYGSSTADLTAAGAVIAAEAGLDLSADALAKIAIAIEPSDGVMFPGWVLFAYRSGAWYQTLGDAVRWPMLVLDPGWAVDTVDFNRRLDLSQVAMLEGQTREAVGLLKQAVHKKDWQLAGQAAQISARAYQSVFYSELVVKALAWSKDLNAAGPVRAHSGSIAGLLFESDESARDALVWLEKRFEGRILLTHTTGGGVEWIKCHV